MPVMSRIIMSLPADLLDRIDAARGDVPRAAWLRKAAEVRLDPEAHELVPRGLAQGAIQAAGGRLSPRQVEPRFKK